MPFISGLQDNNLCEDVGLYGSEQVNQRIHERLQA